MRLADKRTSTKVPRNLSYLTTPIEGMFSFSENISEVIHIASIQRDQKNNRQRQHMLCVIESVWLNIRRITVRGIFLCV